MAGSSLSPELRELIRRVARHPHGLGFLHQATLESVAVTLRADPFVVAEARRLLEVPASRALLIEEVRRARERLPREAEEAPSQAGGSVPASGGWGGEGPVSEVPAAAPAQTPEDLIERARSHPLGEAFLREGAFETVAIIFGVHPNLVLRARAMLETASRGPGKPPAPGGV